MGKREEAIASYTKWLARHEFPKPSFYNLDTRSPAIGLGYLPIMPDGRLRPNVREQFQAAAPVGGRIRSSCGGRRRRPGLARPRSGAFRGPAGLRKGWASA
ncbi:MAG: hypothetical protein H7841_09465 [Magnetospirillum sp. WYHS-4]